MGIKCGIPASSLVGSWITGTLRHRCMAVQVNSSHLPLKMHVHFALVWIWDVYETDSTKHKMWRCGPLYIYFFSVSVWPLLSPRNIMDHGIHRVRYFCERTRVESACLSRSAFALFLSPDRRYALCVCLSFRLCWSAASNRPTDTTKGREGGRSTESKGQSIHIERDGGRREGKEEKGRSEKDREREADGEWRVERERQREQTETHRGQRDRQRGQTQP